jgi:hypothetical protein
MILTVTVIDSTGITISGDQTEISVVNPATSVTYNPTAPFTATNVQDALFESHKMIGEQSNNYSVTLDYGNKFEIQDSLGFARLDAVATSSGWFANFQSSDKLSFITDGNLNALLDNSGSTFYDKLLVEGSDSIVDGIIQTNNTSGDTRHHFQMRSSGSPKGFLGTDSDSVLLGIGSISVALTSAGFFGGDLSPATQYGGTKNNTIDLGKTNSRFRDLYLSDNLYADGVSFEDANITFTTDQLVVNNASNNNLIATTSQGVNLKYNGVQRLATTNSGVSISGGLDATTGNIANLNTSGTLSAGNVVVSGSVAVAGTVDGRDLSVDGDKLDNIEINATADQTDAEIRAAVDAATDSNVYTDAEKTKLTGIETGATADQTDAEIRSAVASATDSNVFTDSEKTKLSGAAELDSSPTFTGTVSSTGLAVDTDTLYVDEANDRVGINTSSPDYNLVVADTGTSTVQIKAGNANYSQLNFGDTDDNDIGQIAYIHDSNEMRFTSNNSQAMVIDSSGRVGIGADIPDETLHLYGGALKIESGAPRIYLTDVNHNSDYSILNDNGLFGIYDDTNTAYRLRIAANGNVGIGSGSPEAKLEVDGAKNDNLLILEGASDNFEFHVTSGDAAVANSSLYRLALERNGADNGFIDFYRGYSGIDGYLTFGSSNTERMRIAANGNVGIGTDDPQRKLHVQDGDIRIESSYPRLYLTDTNNNSDYSIINNNGSFRIYDDTNGAFRMVIDTSGNVGIGTNSPVSALDVRGDISVGGSGASASQLGVLRSWSDFSDADIYALMPSGSTQSGTIIEGRPNAHVVIGLKDNDNNDSFNVIGTGATYSDTGSTADNAYDRSLLCVRSTGRVGIGNNSPQNTLSVGVLDNSSIVDEATVGIKCDANHKGIMLQENSGAEQWSMGVGEGGSLKFYDSDSATPAVTFADISGSVGIGTSSPTFDSGYNGLHISQTAPSIHLTSTSAGTTASDGYAINVNSSGIVRHINKENQPIEFHTNNTQRMRIDSSGNLLVGKTDTNSTVIGCQLLPAGGIYSVRDDNLSAVFDRKTSDGAIVDLRKDGTTVGSIGAAVGNAFVAGTHKGFTFGTVNIYPCNQNGTKQDANTDLGHGSYRLRDIYLSGGVHLGGTASANKLDDYEEGTWTPNLYGSTSGSPSPLSYGTATTQYTKVGRLIYFNAYITNVEAANHSIVGEFRISGMPFAASRHAPITFSYTDLFTFDEIDISVSGYVNSGSTFISVRKGSAKQAVSTTELTNNNLSDFMISGSYTTSS